MGFGLSLITFSPNTVMKSADVNSNFSAINNASTFTGSITSATKLQVGSNPVGAQVDTSGNVTIVTAKLIGYTGNTIPIQTQWVGYGGGVYNHGLGTTPQYVIIFSSGVGHAVDTYAYNNLGSTTVQVYATNSLDTWSGMAATTL